MIMRALQSIAASLLLCTIAHADWTPFAQLSGGARGMEIAQEFRLSDSGTVRDARWDLTAKTVWIRKSGAWHLVDLASGAITDPPQDGTPPAALISPSRSAPHAPARGAQRASEPSADGSMIAISRGGNLFLKCDSKSERQVTSDGTASMRYGTASWVYGEELDQTTGMWWSADGKWLAFYKFDDEKVPQYTLLSGLTKLRPEIEQERYPKPGDANPTAGLCILNAQQYCQDAASDGAKMIRSIDVGTADQYIYGVEFSPRGDLLLFHRLNRRHDVLELCAADPATGNVRVIVREEQPHWNHHLPEMQFLADGRRFIWATERSGFKQYELRSLDDSKALALTTGEFPANKIVEVNESAGMLFYSAFSAPTAINPQLMSVALDGTQQKRLTPEDRCYGRFRIAPDGKYFIASDETISQPPSSRLYRADGTLVATLTEAPTDVWSSRKLPAPELITVKAADGVTDLYATLHFPSNYDPKKSWPLVVDVYGGPYFASVFNRFSAPRAECELGFIVMQVDNRGTPGRGKAFEDATYLKLGGPDMDDQAAAVRQLAQRGIVDPSRVGITGMSYGGYLAALALVRYPEVFSVAVSRAGPMDWRQYDSIYTERFMRTPAENKSGYDEGSVLVHADRMAGKFLLIHGMQDDNVHPSNGWAIAQKLYDREFSFDMLFFPKAGHGGFGPPEEDAMWTFFTRELKANPQGGSLEP